MCPTETSPQEPQDRFKNSTKDSSIKTSIPSSTMIDREDDSSIILQKEPILSLHIIWSIWLRHLKVYLSSWISNSLPPLGEPILYFLTFGYGMNKLLGSVSYRGKEVEYFEFIATGMIGLACLSGAFYESAYSTFIRIRYQKTWQALLTTPANFNDIFWADIIWATTKGIFAGILTAFVTILWGAYSFQSLVVTLPVIFLGSMVFATMGLAAAAFVKHIAQLNLPIFLFIVPMFMLSGTFFPIETFSREFQIITKFLPLSALIEIIRWPFYYSISSILFSLALLTAWLILALFCSYRSLKKKIFG